MTSGLSRRTALGAGAVALGAAAVGTTVPAHAQPAARAATTTPPADATPSDPAMPVRSQFLGREGTAYDGASQWSAHRLTLDGVGDLPGDGDPEHRFSVRFATDDGARDGLYRLSAPGEADALLYLVRVGDAGPVLEGVVDRRSV